MFAVFACINKKAQSISVKSTYLALQDELSNRIDYNVLAQG